MEQQETNQEIIETVHTNSGEDAKSRFLSKFMEKASEPETQEPSDPTPNPTEEEPKANEAIEGEIKVKNSYVLKEAAKREKKALELEQSLKAKQAELESKIKEVESYSQLKDKVKSNPSELLNLLGLKFEDLAVAVLNENKVETLEEKVERLEKERLAEIENRKQSELKAAQEQEEALIADFKNQINNYIDQNMSEKCELIKLTNNEDTVFEVISAHFDKFGTVMDVGQACEMVERYLEEKQFETFQKSKKLSNKLLPKLEPKKVETAVSLKEKFLGNKKQELKRQAEDIDTSKMSRQERIDFLLKKVKNKS